MSSKPISSSSCCSEGKDCGCSDICAQCHATCENLIQHCLTKGGKHTDPNHIKLLRDCAEICQTCANFCIRKSNKCGPVCTACAIISKACADSCLKVDSNDEMMKKCAELCKKCAETCENCQARNKK
jgi:hypothetical protein